MIRPNAQTKAKRDGADSSYTDNYLTWAKYSEYATAVQNKSLTFEYTLATSVPVRQSKSLTAISAKTDTSEDKTGGNLTLQAFYTLDAAKLNEYGTYKVTEGKHLSYKTQGDGALISQALAKRTTSRSATPSPSVIRPTHPKPTRSPFAASTNTPERHRPASVPTPNTPRTIAKT